mmetsp:Transcript_15823/g.42414  ORF Transcript_15823/g.42414 Transcript_15823/m.42414 type:complete len:167 (+) Transcript_15823:63-563(+)
MLRLAVWAAGCAAIAACASARVRGRPAATAAASEQTASAEVEGKPANQGTSRDSAGQAAAMDLVARWMDVQAGPIATLQVIPKYRECAEILEGAWCNFNEHMCTSLAWSAAARFEASLRECEVLRQGKAYRASYERLMEDLARWCGNGEGGAQVREGGAKEGHEHE